MKRNLDALASQTYDLLAIGGGIYGAAVAWEAASRGLSVALVEKGDFGAATSANSLKTIHGGLRYLQTADFKRMRESIRERAILLAIAPHLVHPLPVFLPTYGYGLKGRPALAMALAVNDLISADRNWRLADPDQHIPNGLTMGRSACLERLPDLPTGGLTGAAQFCDAQVYNSERLTVAFLRSAAEAGACLANYVAATGFLREGDRVAGIVARDVQSGEILEIRAKIVLNTSGAWVDRVLAFPNGPAARTGTGLAKAINLVTRPLFPGEFGQTFAVGLASKDASRFYFVSPWRGLSMVGTAYSPYEGDPDAFEVTEGEIQAFLDDFNRAYPAAALTRDDVRLVHGGLLPRTGIDPSGEPELASHYRLRDHAADGAPGLWTLLGVKYTTARDVAAKAIDRALKASGDRLPPSVSAQTPLHGGQMDRWREFLDGAIAQNPDLPPPTVRRLVLNYGAHYPVVLQYREADHSEAGHPEAGHPEASHPENRPASGAAAERAADLAVWRAEARHAVREEMALHLRDLAFSRTELASAGAPDEAALQACAEVMAAELGWSRETRDRQVDRVRQRCGARLPVLA